MPTPPTTDALHERLPFYVRHRHKLLIGAMLFGMLMLAALFAFTWYLAPVTLPATVVLVKSLSLGGAFVLSGLLGGVGFGSITWLGLTVAQWRYNKRLSTTLRLRLKGDSPFRPTAVEVKSASSSALTAGTSVTSTLTSGRNYFSALAAHYSVAVSQHVLSRLKSLWQVGWGAGTLHSRGVSLSQTSHTQWWQGRLLQTALVTRGISMATSGYHQVLSLVGPWLQRSTPAHQALTFFSKKERPMHYWLSYTIQTPQDILRLTNEFPSQAGGIKTLIIHSALGAGINRLLAPLLTLYQVKELIFAGAAQTSAVHLLDKITAEQVSLVAYRGAVDVPAATTTRLTNLCRRNQQFTGLLEAGKQLYQGINGSNIEQGFKLVQNLTQFTKQHAHVKAIVHPLHALLHGISERYPFYQTADFPSSSTMKKSNNTPLAQTSRPLTSAASSENPIARSSPSASEKAAPLPTPPREELSLVIAHPPPYGLVAQTPQKKTHDTGRAAPAQSLTEEESRIEAFAKHDWHGVLGVDKNATELAIKQARNQLVRKWHTDKNATVSAEQVQLINLAYYYIQHPKEAPIKPASESLPTQWTRTTARSVMEEILYSSAYLIQLLEERKAQQSRELEQKDELIGLLQETLEVKQKLLATNIEHKDQVILIMQADLDERKKMLARLQAFGKELLQKAEQREKEFEKREKEFEIENKKYLISIENGINEIKAMMSLYRNRNSSPTAGPDDAELSDCEDEDTQTYSDSDYEENESYTDKESTSPASVHSPLLPTLAASSLSLRPGHAPASEQVDTLGSS